MGERMTHNVFNSAGDVVGSVDVKEGDDAMTVASAIFSKSAFYTRPVGCSSLTQRNYPPIPPNCELFKLKLVGVHTFWMAGRAVWLDRVQPSERPIIAAVARCAWTDEETKRTIECFRIDEIREAFRNAEAWRVWGEQK